MKYKNIYALLICNLIVFRQVICQTIIFKFDSSMANCKIIYHFKSNTIFSVKDCKETSLNIVNDTQRITSNGGTILLSSATDKGFTILNHGIFSNQCEDTLRNISNIHQFETNVRLEKVSRKNKYKIYLTEPVSINNKLYNIKLKLHIDFKRGSIRYQKVGNLSQFFY